MPRLTSILLLLAFVLPGIAPALALSGDMESRLPACCRRHGAHHCMMSMSERQAVAGAHETRFEAPRERCPFCPATAPGASHAPSALLMGALAALLPPQAHSSGVAQAEAMLRVAQIRARQKRGPPQSLSL